MRAMYHGDNLNSVPNIASMVDYKDNKNVEEALDELYSKKTDALHTEYDNTESELEAENVQDAIDETVELIDKVQKDVSSLNENLTMKSSGTIASGDTSITLTDDSFTENAIVDIYFWDKVLAPTKITRENTSITIEIDAQDTDTRVGIFAR